MFDKSAITKLQEEASISNANHELTDHKLENKVIALPSDYKIHNLEEFDKNRARFRGAFQTKSTSAFADYAIKNATEGATAFIDSEKMSSKLIVNLGNKNAPGHCDHYAKVTLEKTAPFIALLKIVDQRKTQKEIAEFIEDWRKYLTASSEEDIEGNATEMSIIKALHAVRKITIEAKETTGSETRNFGASTSSMESVDIASADMPPAFFHFKTQPYSELKERTFDLRLSIITDRVPALVLRIVRFEEHEEQMAEEFKQKIESDLENSEPKICTYVGTFTD